MLPVLPKMQLALDDEVAVTPVRDVVTTAPKRPSQRLETFIVAGGRFTLP